MPAQDVAVRELVTTAELAAAEALFAATWPGRPPASSGLLRAVAHAGGYVAGAFDGARDPSGGGELLGAAMGFLADHDGPALHSHLAAVVPAARGRGVGLALKLHQRAWAARHHLATVTWTFDPLVRRNAWFNLGKLGAGIGAYLPDFYGPMDDGVNDGDATDRLLAVWPVTGPAPAAPAPAGPAMPLVPVLEGVAGRPLARAVPGAEAGPPEGGAVRLAVATPADVEALRATDRDLALAWRHAVRDALAPLLERGRVTGFTRSGAYLVDVGGTSPGRAGALPPAAGGA